VPSIADGYRPALKACGEAARWVLAQMTGKWQVSDLADQVGEQFPTAFPGPGEAVQFVKKLAERYS